MNLPTKSLNVLATIRQELLFKQELTKEQKVIANKKTEKKVRRMFRMAKTKCPAFQRACRRKDFWAPVY